MKVLTVYAHPNPKSFCHAVLEEFAYGSAYELTREGWAGLAAAACR